MKLHRSSWVLLAAVALLGTVTTSAHAQGVIHDSPVGPNVRGPHSTPSYSSYWYSYNPYVAPYPAYGILPPPFLLNPWQTNLGYIQNKYATPPRKRASLYPDPDSVVQAPPVPAVDIHSVRFEITVPSDKARVLIDGVETKQTGLSRVYVTPPMGVDRLFTSAFEVHWTDEQGKAQSKRATFEFVAGETIRHTFK